MSDDQGPWGSPPPQPATPQPRRHTRQRRLLLALGVAGVLGAAAWALTTLFPGRVAADDDRFTLAYRLGLIALVSASLFSRGLKLGETLRNIALWAAVFGALALGYAFRGEMSEAALRVRSELVPGYVAPAGDHQLVLSQDADGAFSVMAQVNGQPVRFVVDTGASDIVLAPADAARLGVDVAGLKFTGAYETANGVGQGAPFIADALTIGPVRLSKVAMSINRAPMSASLLGMSFLNRMRSFNVRDGRLYLTWRG